MSLFWSHPCWNFCNKEPFFYTVFHHAPLQRFLLVHQRKKNGLKYRPDTSYIFAKYLQYITIKNKYIKQQSCHVRCFVSAAD